MKKPKLYCYSHTEFDMMCSSCGWNDDNLPSNSCFISIIGTPECQKYYLEEDELHWFKKDNSSVVLNLEFDDIPSQEIEWKGHKFFRNNSRTGSRSSRFYRVESRKRHICSL
jgi:hypothetical protein